MGARPSPTAPVPLPAAGIPLVEELTPAPDPWDVARRLAHLPHLIFLDSAEQHSTRGRYSFVAADPAGFIVGRVEELGADPFAAVRAGLRRFPSRGVEGLPPFQGGYAGVFGY